MLALVFAMTLTMTPAPSPIGIDCGRPCVIEGSEGGKVGGFRNQGRDLANAKTPVIVDGPCLSACTLLVDADRANVCLTSRAVLGYHQSWWDDAKGVRHYDVLTYETPGLNAYLDAHGGEPQAGPLLMLSFDDAKVFYPPCAGA